MPTTTVRTTKTKNANTAKKTTPVKEKSTVRKQVSKLVGIDLSVSRVRSYVDKKNVNSDIENAITELRNFDTRLNAGEKLTYETLSEPTRNLVAQAYTQIYDPRKQRHDTLKARLSKSKSAEDKKKLNALPAFKLRTDTTEERIDLVAKLRRRFSSDASIALSSGLDYLVQELVRAAMVNARSLGKAIIQVDHIVSHDEFSKLSVYPLVNTLKVVQDAMASTLVNDTDNTDKTKKNTVATTTTTTNATKTTKTANTAKTLKTATETKTTDTVDTDVDTNVVTDQGSSFEFYVIQICKNVKEQLVADNEEYKSIRISKSIRKFCSDVVIQTIERLSPLIKLYSETANVKTVNDDVVKFVFKLLLLDAGVNYTPFMQFIDDKLKVYHDSRTVTTK